MRLVKVLIQNGVRDIEILVEAPELKGSLVQKHPLPRSARL